MVWRVAGKLLNSLWLLVALVVIALAIVVAIGRELLPHANHYQSEVTRFLSARTGLKITTDSVQGTWTGLSPRLVANGLEISSPDGEQAIVIDSATAQLDLLRSLASFAPVWRELEASGVVVTVVEDADGSWSVAGLPLGGGDGRGFDSIRDLLVETRLLRIDEASVDLQFYSGAVARLRAPQTRIDNTGDFHRTVASLAVADSGDDTARLVFEGRGDVAGGGSFSGRGYIEIHRLNFDGNLSAIAQRWFPEQVARVGDIETDIDLALWFDWHNGGLVNGRGTLKAAEIPLNWVADAGSLTALEAEITSWYQPGKDWGVRLQNLQVNWGKEAVGPLNLEFRQRVGRRWGELDLAMDSLDLALTHRLLHSTELLGERLDDVLAQLEPSGLVRGLQLDIDISAATPAVLVRGNLNGVSVGSWRGAPAARGVHGYFEVRGAGGGEGASGFVELDSEDGLALHYPRVYDDFMPYGATRGRIDWRYRPAVHQVEVNSGPIAIDGEEGQGTVWLYLDIPTMAGMRKPEMSLMVTLRNSEARFVDRYLPAILPETLKSWLDSALGEGDIPEAGFLWRGSLVGNDPAGRTVQVYARIERASLDYQPGDWPALSGVSATLLVDDDWADVWADGAAVGDGSVQWARAALRPADGGGQVLTIRGEIDASVDYGLRVLRASPVGSGLDALDSWQVEGEAAIDLDLAIPLGSVTAEQEYRVGVDVDGGRVFLPGARLDIEDIAGRVNFSLAQGLDSSGLRGRFLGQPLNATLATRDGVTSIDFDSRLPVESFASYLGVPLGFVSGAADFAGQLRISDTSRPPELHLTSDLQGIAIDLPPPFTKLAESPSSLDALLTFRGNELRIEGRVEEMLAIALQLDKGHFRRGVVELLSDTAQQPAQSGLLVRGSLERFDWAQWQPLVAGGFSVAGDNDERRGGGGSAIGELVALSPRLDITFGDFVFGGFELGQTTLHGELGADKRWQLALASERVAGEIVPGGSRTLVRLNHLHLPSLTLRAEGEESLSAAGSTPSVLDRFDPRTIPALDFAVDKITVDGRELGRLAFLSTPLSDGVRFEAIHGSLRGITLPVETGENALELAELEWRLDGDRHHTRFAGTLLVDDFAATLESWQLQPLIDSRNAAFHMDLTWPQQPWNFALAKLEGHIGIDLDSGQFHRAAGAPTNTFLRLVSLLNFDTWLRRLRFDFSDLFNQGVSFDHLRGGLAFADGTVRFDDPIVATMPSGRVRLLGSADMVREQLDARLVATLPVGTNLPWVAAVLGGLPAAAGVYVTGRLFRRQVDQLSSLSYRVTGPWDDPKLEVDKIFSDRTDLEGEQ